MNAIRMSPAAQDAVCRFQCVIDELVNTLGNLSAIAALDVRGQPRHYFTAGHVDKDRSVPATRHHLFQIGSQSKTIAAIVLLILHRANLLDLDQPVRAYLDLPIDPDITIRHLAMNTCGLGEVTFAIPQERRDPRIAFKPRDLVALALPQGQLFPPGAQFDYCNTGWIIAAMLVEHVCGKSYGHVVDERLVQPLGLADTSFGGAAPSARMLRGYIRNKATIDFIDTSDCLSWAFGAGDGVSSLDDMLELFGSLLRDDSAIGVTIADLIAITGKPAPSPFHPMSLGTEYGLGIERRTWGGRPVWGHPGSTTSYVSGTWIDIDLGVVLTTCVTRSVDLPMSHETELRYPRAQLFAMGLSTAYALAQDRDS